MTTSSVKRRTTTVLLFQGDDRERMEELLSEAAGAMVGDGPSRVGDAKGVAAVEAYNAFLPEAEGRAVRVGLTAVGRLRWREMFDAATKTVERSTPGEDGEKVTESVDELDHAALADVLVPESLTTPTFESAAQRQAFLDDLNDADFNRLYTAAFQLNRTSGIVAPKALSVSELMGNDDETLNSPEP